LLLAHAKGRVLFITGAGSSAAARLPSFQKLVLDTYETLDSASHANLMRVAVDGGLGRHKLATLNDKQKAEVHQFARGNYDVVLGMLERRIDGTGKLSTTVRERIADVIRTAGKAPAPIHHALVRLSERGGASSVATTNFDLLLEYAAARQRRSMQSYSLGGIPRPSLSRSFAGVFHIHGALDPQGNRVFDFIVNDEDFGEFYMRRRVVPDFVYDAARLFHIVLVGYSANDPPMRYLLSAVAADGSRFEDFKERFTFVGDVHPPDPVRLEDWRGRGITPIPYSSAGDHTQLLTTLDRWAGLSAHGTQDEVDKALRRIVKTPRASTPDQHRDLFDHFIRRADPNERLRLTRIASAAGAEPAWFDAIIEVSREPKSGNV
jgi:hypothetical protein